MNQLYAPCPCNSGKKYKFCCHKQFQELIPIEKAKIATQYPLHLCTVNKNEEEGGLRSILVIRKMPTGNYIVGCYLLDTWCLGIKSCDLKFDVTPQEVSNIVKYYEIEFSSVPISYEDTRSLIFGGVAFSSQFGFFPYDPEWQVAREFLEPDRPFEQKFTYGNDGKLLYVEGPHDKDIVQRVREKLQEHNGNYILCLN